MFGKLKSIIINIESPLSKLINKNYFFITIGILLILISNYHLFSKYTIKWDAFLFWYPIFSWMGCCIRSGYFGDFLPYYFSGYPLGGDIQAGIFNPIYNLGAILFPHSFYSVNFVYLCIFILAFYFGFKSYKLIKINSDLTSAFYFGLCACCNGLFIGNSEHLSYLSSALGFIICIYAFLLSIKYKYKKSIVFYCIGFIEFFTAGYPPLVLYFSFSIFVMSLICSIVIKKWKILLLFFLSVILSAIICFPAIFHQLVVILQSTRSNGLSTEFILLGSLPLNALIKIFLPFQVVWEQIEVDISMDRFHLLTISPWLSFVGVFYLIRNNKRLFYVLLLSFVFCMLWILGQNAPVPLRRFFADLSFIFRLGRFICSEFKYQALLILAFLSAYGLDHIFLKLQGHNYRKLIIILFLCIDFAFVMFNTREIRYFFEDQTRPPFIVEFNETIPKKEFARYCSEKNENSEQNAIFSWRGYSPLLLSSYINEMVDYENLLCDQNGHRFFDQNGKPIQYTLINYTPSYVSITLDEQHIGDISTVWAETTDSFWTAKFNGNLIPILKCEASLRCINFPTGFKKGDLLEFQYQTPIRNIINLELKECLSELNTLFDNLPVHSVTQDESKEIDFKTFFQTYNKENFIILLAVKTDAQANLSLSTINYFKQKKGNLEKLDFCGSYAAVFEDGQLVKEALSNEASVEIKYQTGMVSFFLKSAGLLFGNNSMIMLNNYNLSLNTRGFNAVVIQKKPLIVTRCTFNTNAISNPSTPIRRL